MSSKRSFPAEWANQDAVLIAWPYQNGAWAPLYPEIEEDFLAMANAILRHESLVVLCQNKQHHDHIKTLFTKSNCLALPIFIEVSYDDTWCRDFGPISVICGSKTNLLNFEFNGWGGRYQANNDNAISNVLSDKTIFSSPILNEDLIIEGGSIESNGVGGLLTTEKCLLNSNRNHFSKPRLEAILHESLGIDRFFWLKNGALEGDDTDCHIDNLARFVSEGRIAYLRCEDSNDQYYVALKKMRDELLQFKRANNQPYELTPLPLPEPCYSKIDKRRLPASYLNFLIINNAVLVPQFGVKQDQYALEQLQQCFPKREIIGIYSRRFIEQNGGIHCLTMQLHQGTLNKEYITYNVSHT